jgi:hypothetical protein
MGERRTKVGIEMDDRNFAVHGVDGAKQWKHNCVVPTEGNDSRMVFAIEGEGYECFSRDRIITQG